MFRIRHNTTKKCIINVSLLNGEKAPSCHPITWLTLSNQI